MGEHQREKIIRRLTHEPITDFEALALDLYRYQAAENPLYGEFVRLLGRNPQQATRLTDIPFLPISFFKTHPVKTGAWTAQTEFTSSGTTGQTPSRHAVRDLDAYLQNTLRGFEQFYGDPQEWLVLALLPSYLERSGSSLVAMAEYFIRRSAVPGSGFFLHNLPELAETLHGRDRRRPTLLLGVSFALLDFAEQFPMDLSDVVVMETGGMKGRRKEMTRPELHQTLIDAFQCPQIHSEYGMTELLSQGYARGGNIFYPCATLRTLTVEINDPFCPAQPGKTGQLLVADLANIDTCCFIATEDVGKIYPDGGFEVLGRLDTAEMRGCNLMVE